MSKFKIGDEVRVVNPRESSVSDMGKVFVITTDEGEWEGEQSWSGARRTTSYRHKESALEFNGPVRTRTVTEIVNGVYGRISIAKQGGDEPRLLIALANLGGGTEGVHHGWSLDELKAAISTLTAIRDALEPEK